MPANRYGRAVDTTAQLETLQEVITLVVFAAFSVLWLKETITINHVVGFALIAAGPWFVLKAPLWRLRVLRRLHRTCDLRQMPANRIEQLLDAQL